MKIYIVIKDELWNGDRLYGDWIKPFATKEDALKQLNGWADKCRERWAENGRIEEGDEFFYAEKEDCDEYFHHCYITIEECELETMQNEKE